MHKKYIFHYLILFQVLLLSCSSSKNDDKVFYNTTDSIETTEAIIDTSSLFVNYDNKYSYRIFFTKEKSTGFGYELFVSNKRYIHQPTIPAVNGYKSFKSREDAQKIAELVINKMIKQNEKFPSINLKELDSLKIIY